MREGGMRLWLAACVVGFPALAGTLRAAAADEVSVAVRDRIEENLSGAFILPQTTVWRFDEEKAYVSGERVVCGWVNFQSAQQRYVGYHQFYAIMNDGQVDLAQIDDPVSDTSGKLAGKLKLLCGSDKPPA